MLMIKSMDMVNFTGQMGDVIEDIGLMENSMVVGFIEEAMESKEKGNGTMGKNSNGLMNEYNLFFNN